MVLSFLCSASVQPNHRKKNSDLQPNDHHHITNDHHHITKYHDHNRVDHIRQLRRSINGRTWTSYIDTNFTFWLDSFQVVIAYWFSFWDRNSNPNMITVDKYVYMLFSHALPCTIIMCWGREQSLSSLIKHIILLFIICIHIISFLSFFLFFLHIYYISITSVSLFKTIYLHFHS